MTHHKHLGDETKSNLGTLFESSQKNFEDGDALFVAHRMKLKGDIGPKMTIKVPRPKVLSMLLRSRRRKMGKRRKYDDDDTSSSSDIIAKDSEAYEKTVTMSISNTGFRLWKEGRPLRNSLVFTTSFLFERILLIVNDIVVAGTGRNYFFPNKPKSFHEEVTKYCRASVAVKLGLCFMAKSWKALFFLYLAETLWSIPPHPACAMFITNHGSKMEESDINSSTTRNSSGCIPSSSTYAGRLYSLFTLGTNFHVEHHDFPTIPLHDLGKLQQIAPEFYTTSHSKSEKRRTKDNVFKIMKETFAKPEFYACMDMNVIHHSL